MEAWNATAGLSLGIARRADGEGRSGPGREVDGRPREETAI